MLSYRIFGVHDWAARLVPGLAGCLTVLATFLWGRRVAGERAALAGALVLCLSARFDPLNAAPGLIGLLTRAADVPDFATLEAHLADTETKVRASFKRIVGASP